MASQHESQWSVIFSYLGGRWTQVDLFGGTFCFVERPETRRERVGARVAMPIATDSTNGENLNVTWTLQEIPFWKHQNDIERFRLNRLALQSQNKLCDGKPDWVPIAHNPSLLDASTIHHVSARAYGYESPSTLLKAGTTPRNKKERNIRGFARITISGNHSLKANDTDRETTDNEDHIGYSNAECTKAIAPMRKYEDGKIMYIVWERLDMEKSKEPTVNRKNMEQFVTESKVTISELTKKTDIQATYLTSFLVRSITSLDVIWFSWEQMIKTEAFPIAAIYSHLNSEIERTFYYFRVVSHDNVVGLLLPVELSETPDPKASRHRIMIKWYFLPYVAAIDPDIDPAIQDKDVEIFFVKYQIEYHEKKIREREQLEKTGKEQPLVKDFFQMQAKLLADTGKEFLLDIMTDEDTLHEVHQNRFRKEPWAHSRIGNTAAQ